LGSQEIVAGVNFVGEEKPVLSFIINNLETLRKTLTLAVPV